jgi:diguanylate cyclase (GGDEF)-like protein
MFKIMLMKLDLIINFGTQKESTDVAHKVRMLNFIVLFTIFIALIYTANYYFVLNNQTVAVYNLLLTFSYSLSLIFSYFHHHRSAKTCYFSLLMLHLFVCTNIFFTKESGFHFYYFLVPTGALLLFELKDRSLKFLLSIIAASLYLYCENTLNESPLISLSESVKHLLYQSVFLVNMLSVTLVLTLFSKQIEKHQLELVIQASTDMLTGLNNRRYFFKQGERLLEQHNKKHQILNLLLLDLDYFKNINDQYGHSVGDSCLVAVSDLLKNSSPTDHFCYRIGGEEFVILSANSDYNIVVKLAENIRKKIEALIVIGENGDKIGCTVSIGISYNQNKTDTLKQILKRADLALYKAKNAGRNNVVLYRENT